MTSSDAFGASLGSMRDALARCDANIAASEASSAEILEGKREEKLRRREEVAVLLAQWLPIETVEEDDDDAASLVSASEVQESVASKNLVKAPSAPAGRSTAQASSWDAVMRGAGALKRSGCASSTDGRGSAAAKPTVRSAVARYKDLQKAASAAAAASRYGSVMRAAKAAQESNFSREQRKVRVLLKLDLDESPDAPPVSEQLASALKRNATRVLDLFRSWDANGDGQVTRREFIEAMVEFGLEVPKRDICELFDAWDKDGGGAISFGELRTILSARMETARQQQP